MKNSMTTSSALTQILSATAILATVSVATVLTSPAAMAAGNSTTAKVKSKQCVMLYSPRYKKLRIKPIQFSFRWCSAANPKDCTKWTSDTVSDVGKSFSIVAHCFTHHASIKMELRYNRRFGDVASQVGTTIKPHAMKLKGNLAPHPLCAKKAAHRFVMKRDGALIKSGKPRNVVEPKCVWKPVKTKAAS